MNVSDEMGLNGSSSATGEMAPQHVHGGGGHWPVPPGIPTARSTRSPNLPLPAFREIAWLVHPQRTLKGAGDRALFVWRSLRSQPHARLWYAWLSQSFMAPATGHAPGLYKKIVRPYLTPRWNNAQKLRALQEHYAFFSERLVADDFRRMFVYPGLPLLEFTGRDGHGFRVFVGHDAKCNKEGELSLLLYSEKHALRVSSLIAIVLRRPGGGHELLIGGIQGLPDGADKNIIEEVAKSLHGLRPKALLLFLAQELAAAWNLEAVSAISNQLHISRHRAYALNSSRRPKLAYDEFWEECGGHRRDDGFYDLPLCHAPRDLHELKPGKRSLYRQRYALMESLGFALRRSLHDSAAGAV